MARVTGDRTSWGVVATVSEPLPLVLAYVAHHLGRGARRVWLFLDRPDPVLERAVAHLPQVETIRADPEAWEALHGMPRPAHGPGRQVVNHQMIYARGEVEWLLHLDADEYLRSVRPVEDVLAEMPDGIDWIWLILGERVRWRGAPVRRIFEGVFRRPLVPGRFGKAAEAHARAVYGDTATRLLHGLSGHILSKSLLRRGRADFLPAVHHPHLRGGGDPLKLPHRRPNGMRLLHFDGITPYSWGVKLRRAAAGPDADRRSPARQAQFARVRAEGHDAAKMLAMHDELLTIDAGQAEKLRELDALDERPFDPLPAVRRFFPHERLTLSAAEFDLFTRAWEAQRPPPGRLARWWADPRSLGNSLVRSLLRRG